MWAQNLGLEDNGPDWNPATPDDFPVMAPCRFDGLATVLSHVDETFTECDLGRDFWVEDGVLTDLNDVRDKPGWGYWELVDLVEWVITREALPAWGFLGLHGGNPWRVFDMRPPRMTDPRSEPSRLEELLERLDTGAGYWIHGGGGYAEGVCGWLNAADTRELATLLPRRPVESSDKQAEQRAFWTVLDWSIANGLGLLWGRDLAIFYQRGATMFDPEETPIIRVA